MKLGNHSCHAGFDSTFQLRSTWLGYLIRWRLATLQRSPFFSWSQSGGSVLMKTCDWSPGSQRNLRNTCLILSQIARFMGPTWGPPGTDRTQVGPMLAPWSLLSGVVNTVIVDGLVPSRIDMMVFVRIHTNWGTQNKFPNSHCAWHAWWDLTMSPPDSLLEQCHRVYSIIGCVFWATQHTVTFLCCSYT